MQTRFEELNLYAYNVLRSACYDVVIWCLGPLIDESRPYGQARLVLAAVACAACRRLMRIED